MSITKALHQEYKLFIFYNITRYVIYIKDELQIIYINKGLEI